MKRLWTAVGLVAIALAGFGLAGCAIGNADRAATLTLPTLTHGLTTVTEAHTETTQQTLTLTTTETRNHVIATTVATTLMQVTTAPPQTVVLTVATPTPTTTTDTAGVSGGWGWVVILLLAALVTIGIIWLVRSRKPRQAQ